MSFGFGASTTGGFTSTFGAPATGGFGGFGAPAAGGFAAPGTTAVGGFGAPAAAPVATALSSELPAAIDTATLDEVDAALNSASAEKFLAIDANAVRTKIIEPFLKGFEQRKNLDEEIRRGVAQPVALPAAVPAGFGFGQPQPAAAAMQPQSTDEQLKLKIAAKFSYDQIFETNAASPGFRTVAAAHADEFVKVGLGNMKDKKIALEEIEPWLKLAAEVIVCTTPVWVL
jgi:hypothetical protein